MAVLVTGATGFVGSWLVRELVKRGEQVHILHRPNSTLDDLKGLDVVSCPGDVTDIESLRKACQGMDTVFHLAGVIGYSRSMRQQMVEVNIRGTAHVLEAVEKSSAKLIYMSSVVAVGASFKPQPLNENSTYNVRHLDLGYFETKKAAEDLVQNAVLERRVQAVILNPSTIYGPGDAKKGSRKTQIKVARAQLPFYTSGGVSIVSVHDVVNALIAARTLGENGERYILSGENITIKDLFQRIARMAGVKPPAIYLPNWVVHGLGAVGEIMENFGKKGPLSRENAWTATLFHWFDHSKASRKLGFNPRPADQALSESVEWMKQNGYLT